LLTRKIKTKGRNNMRLYELSENFIKLQEMFENDLIEEQTYKDTFEILSFESEDKIEGVCKVIKNLEAEQKAFSDEIERLQNRKKVIENGVKRLKDSIISHMKITNNKKINAGLFKVTKIEREVCNITNEEAVPAEYLIEQKPRVDKTSIKSDLKDGKKIAGVELAKTEYITIR